MLCAACVGNDHTVGDSFPSKGFILTDLHLFANDLYTGSLRVCTYIKVLYPVEKVIHGLIPIIL
jgi:hypothetical protein